MSGGKLPEGWVNSKFTDLMDVQGGTQPPKSEFIPEAQNGYIRLLQIRDFGKKPVPTYIPETKKLKTCREEDLLIGRYGASLGRICTGHAGAYNVALAKVIYPHEFERSFIRYYLESEIFQFPLRLLSRSAQNGFNKEDLSRFDFLLAPLAEQKILAEKLDTLLAQVDSTKARLEQIPQILKRFRQAVLSTAASGCLTNKWRERCTQKEEIDLVVSKYKPTDNLFKQAKQSLPDIPQSWRVVPSAHLIEYVTSGSRGWANYYSTEGALFLRMSNVRYNTTRLDLQDLQFVNLPSHVEGKRSLVKIDDLIISLTADVGRVARIDKDLGEAYINQHLALLRPNNNINSEYFALSIAAQNIGVKQIQSLKRGATKVGLGLDDIRSLAIPLPSLEEQHEIVRRVEQLFAYADTIEKQVNNALTRVNNLTQSILAKAFRGELTAQWRAENPDLISGENSAAAQLEKIKAERAASGGKKNSRKKA